MLVKEYKQFNSDDHFSFYEMLFVCDHFVILFSYVYASIFYLKKFIMKKFKLVFSIILGSITFYACKKSAYTELQFSAAKTNSLKNSNINDNSPGAVYVLSNAANGNRVLVYSRSFDGTLSQSNSVATGGNGTGSGLGSQGAVLFYTSGATDYVIAVNAGSNDVSVFRSEGTVLTWIDKVSSQGTLPISVTAHDDLLYVLNAGGSGNISGFRISSDGHLAYLANSSKALSSNDAGPAEIQFSNDGKQLVVTEKNTNTITTYSVNENGLAASGITHASIGTTPFGFAFDNHDHLLVTDAFGGAAGQSAVTSYDLSAGNFSLVDGPAATHQTSACWLAVTDNGKYCYATNTSSGTISGYRIEQGKLSLLNDNGITATTGTTPGDVALSVNSKFLYNVNSTSHTITSFRVNEDGSLNAIGTVNNLPSGTAGIAAQ